MLTAMLIIFLLFVMVSTSRGIPTDNVYGLLGEEVVLTPEPISEVITEILWKCGDDKAAEWETRDKNPDYYREFKNRASLNVKNGEMTIRNLTQNDSKMYEAKINSQLPAKRSLLFVINRVSKPNLDQACNDSMCILSCKGEITTEGQYAWREGEGKWEKSEGKGDQWEVWKSNEKFDKSYTCNHSNPLSYAVSDPIVPFPSGVSVGMIIGLLVFGFVAALCVGAAVVVHIWKRKRTGSLAIPARCVEDESQRKEGSHAQGQEGTNEEATPLNQMGSNDGEDGDIVTIYAKVKPHGHKVSQGKEGSHAQGQEGTNEEATPLNQMGSNDGQDSDIITVYATVKPQGHKVSQGNAPVTAYCSVQAPVVEEVSQGDIITVYDKVKPQGHKVSQGNGTEMD